MGFWWPLQMRLVEKIAVTKLLRFKSTESWSWLLHYNDLIMIAKSPASPLFTQPFIQVQIKRKHQSSESLSRATVPLLRYAPLTWQRYGGSGTGYESLAFVRGIHRRPANSPHKWPVTRKMFPFDDVIMSGDDLSPRHCLNQGWLTLMAHVHTINDPFYWHGLTLIPAWISNHIQCKMGDDITYPFSNFRNG